MGDKRKLFLITYHPSLITGFSSSFPQFHNAASRDAAAKGELATLARALAKEQIEQVKQDRSRDSRSDELKRCLLDKSDIRRLSEHAVKQHVDAVIKERRACQNGDARQLVVQIEARRQTDNQKRHQRLGKAACAEQPSAQGIGRQSGNRADKQRLQGVALQRNIDYHNQRQVNVNN